MGRLMDESELIKGRVENDPVVIAAKCAPTAYDPDKVVEQLEKRRMDALRHLQENKGTAFGRASEWVYNAWNEADEIVKGGGADAKTDS